MQNKSDYDNELRNQLSIIRNTMEMMRGRATYGSFEKFLKHLSTIEQAASKMTERLDGKGFFSTNTKYRKVLVPFDGSKYSKKALSEAVEISNKFSSKLYIITIVDISGIKPPGMLLGIMKDKKMRKLSTLVLESAYSKAEQMLQNEAERCKKTGIETYCDVMTGKVSESILRFVKRQQIDLIIMGSKGLSGFSRMLALGSVSRKVSEEAPCPIMIVR